MGRNPAAPWKRQSDLISIDEQQDFISDQGTEIWSILSARGIDHVLLAGVHTNMCVLGRPFGLRQMAKHGKSVALIRDLTDTMYNPQRWPFVNHHTGTDLIVEYIEKCVCPTITSDQILGGAPFRFSTDRRRQVAMIIGEDEYRTAETLPGFALYQLGNDFRVSTVFAKPDQRDEFPGFEVLPQADAALISVRRRFLTEPQMNLLREFINSGKPIIGIRTASHAFALSNGTIPTGHVDWPSFDADVLGGHYSGHYANELRAEIAPTQAQRGHPILRGSDLAHFQAGGSLYKLSPVADGATVLMSGTVQGQPAEPVAWTYIRPDGGRSFYTSLGHPADFENSQFVRMLRNSIYWSLDMTPPAEFTLTSELAKQREAESK